MLLGALVHQRHSVTVGIKRNITSFLPEVYEGRAGQPRGAEEMWRSVYFLGNII